MKKCPFCAEEIQDEAIKCKHCAEFLDGSGRATVGDNDATPWYFRTGFVLIALVSVGPFALPLIWWHPRIKPGWKIVWTLIVLTLSWLLLRATLHSINILLESYRQLGL